MLSADLCEFAGGVACLREIDLHGLKLADALHLFVETFNSVASSGKPEPVKVIHGYGSSGTGGEIRRRVRDLLKRNPHSGSFVTGEEMENNPGFTVVYPRHRLPEGSERLWDSIIEFCLEPRTQEEIVRRFIRRSPEPEIMKALHELLRRGRIRESHVNGKKRFLVGDK
jgi:hypothetical protein